MAAPWVTTSGTMAWHRIARERCKARRCCRPLSHTLMAGLQTVTTSKTTRRCNARERCKTRRRCWHLRRDVMMLQRSAGLQSPQPVWPCARARTAARSADTTGTAPGHRSARPTHLLVLRELSHAPMAAPWATTSGTLAWCRIAPHRSKACLRLALFAHADGSPEGNHLRHDGKALHRTQEM